MNKLINLELKRNSLKAYHIAVAITSFVMLAFLYLFASIPKIDPTDTDNALFQSYDFIIGLSNVVCMAVFAIMSAVMASKLIIEEYAPKKAILLFSYPVERKKILNAKIVTVFGYTFLSMLITELAILLIFFVTESHFALCSDTITFNLILGSVLSAIAYSLIAALLGVVSLWFGFLKKSISVTIVAAVIIVSAMCQVIAMSLFYRPVIMGMVALSLIAATIVWSNLQYQVKKMEV